MTQEFTENLASFSSAWPWSFFTSIQWLITFLSFLTRFEWGGLRTTPIQLHVWVKLSEKTSTSSFYTRISNLLSITLLAHYIQFHVVYWLQKPHIIFGKERQINLCTPGSKMTGSDKTWKRHIWEFCSRVSSSAAKINIVFT